MMEAAIFPGQGRLEEDLILVDTPEKESLYSFLGEMLGERVSKKHLLSHEAHSALVVCNSISCFRSYERESSSPEIVCGYSVGQIAAYATAGVLSDTAAVSLAHERARLMSIYGQSECGMLSIIGLNEEQITEELSRLSYCERVYFACKNSAFNFTLSGERKDLAFLKEHFEHQEAKQVNLLPVAGAWHSPLLLGAVPHLRQLLDKFEFATPQRKLVCNSGGEVLSTPGELREELLRHLIQPVLWSECVEQMVKLGAKRFVECGAGSQLKKILFFMRLPNCVSMNTAGEITKCAA